MKTNFSLFTGGILSSLVLLCALAAPVEALAGPPKEQVIKVHTEPKAQEIVVQVTGKDHVYTASSSGTGILVSKKDHVVSLLLRFGREKRIIKISGFFDMVKTLE